MMRLWGGFSGVGSRSSPHTADGKSLWILVNGRSLVTAATALAASILAAMMFEKRPRFSKPSLSVMASLIGAMHT